VLEPLLSVRMATPTRDGERHHVSDRICTDAIGYVRRTGCSWRTLNQTELCAKSTAYDRFQEGARADVFRKLWETGGARFDELQGIDWDRLRRL
jgi:transposase